MKKLAYLLLLSISLFSCSKSSDQEPKEEQLYDVSFNVSVFNQEVVDLKATQALSGVVTYLHYFVLDQGGEIIYYTEYKHTDDDFGTIKDKLPEGDYQIVFIGMHETITEEELDGIYLYTAEYQLKDTYSKSLSISVPSEKAEQSIQLDRIVGKLELIFTDKIPSEVKTIDYVLMNCPYDIELPTGRISEGEINKNSAPIIISDDDKDNPNYQIDIFELANESGNSHDLIINCYDVNGDILETRKLTDIMIYRNKITRLSGEMFSSTKNNENNFTLTLDTDWAEVIEKGFDAVVPDETAPTVTFVSPSPNSTSPTAVTAGQDLPFNISLTDNQQLKSITFDATTTTKSVNDFLTDFGAKLTAAVNASASITGKSDAVMTFNVGVLTGAPAGVYKVTCNVTDTSENTTKATAYFDVR